jgi:hypothetical protein
VDDPFIDLIVESLNLTHPRFAGTAARSFRYEFYHQFRHLWDKALPVQLGLGHVVIQDDPAIPHDPRPDFLFWQVGEKGQPDRRLGAVSLALLSDAPAALEQLRQFSADRGSPNAVCVIAGRAAEVLANGLPSAPGVTVVFFDVDRWSAIVINPGAA